MNNASKLFLIFLLLLSKQVLSNKIDGLKTDKDVNEFVKSMNPDFIKDKDVKFEVQASDSIAKYLSCNGIFKSWGIKNWEKADITNDGLTDLVFVAHWYDYISYAFIDTGNNKFKLIRFSKNPFENCEFIKPVKAGSNNCLRVFRKTIVPDAANKQPFSDKEVIIIDTLVFKFDNFIEHGRLENTRNEIESIKINTSGCFGSCPAFNLKLFRKGLAEFEGIAFTRHKGKSSKKLPQKYFNEINDLCNYINVKKLKDSYTVNWTDDQTATLTVIFKDHSIKVIKDYGMQGTFGLSAIYQKLLKIETKWN
jgi:hypothetical protein